MSRLEHKMRISESCQCRFSFVIPPIYRVFFFVITEADVVGFSFWVLFFEEIKFGADYDWVSSIVVRSVLRFKNSLLRRADNPGTCKPKQTGSKLPCT